MVSIDAVIGCWIGCMSLLVTSWTIVWNWFPTKFGIYVSGTIGCSITGYTFLGT